METWEEKIREKILSVRLSEEPDNEKVVAFFNKLDTHEETKVIPLVGLQSKSIIWVAAAVVLLALTSVISYQLSFVSIQTQTAEVRNIFLPDGSGVKLNAASTLKYNKLGWYLQRSVDFEGEGYFMVENGRKFTVVSSEGSTSVLGTEFNISTTNGKYEVKCFEGRVAVSLQKEEVELTVGEKVSAESGPVMKETFSIDRPDWRVGEYYFDNQKLEKILLDFKRVYDVSIKIDHGLLTKTYSGYFPAGNMSLALKLICDPLDLVYEVEGRSVTIRASE